MDTKVQQVEQQGLNSVLEAIRSATSRIYKDEDGVSFSQVPSAKLFAWAATIAEYKKTSSEEVQKDLRLVEYSDMVTQLRKAVEAKDIKMTTLESQLKKQEKVVESNAKEHAKEVSALKLAKEKAQKDLAEANANKAATLNELKVVSPESLAKNPDAKFNPEVAEIFAKQRKGLESDLTQINTELAAAKAQLSKATSDLDAAYKKRATERKTVDEAQAELANFKRALVAANNQIRDLFSDDEFDKAALIQLYGESAVAKLTKVLEVPAFSRRPLQHVASSSRLSFSSLRGPLPS
jgi:chromosome segregation ATPase